MSDFKYKAQYGVVVLCADEKQQREIYKQLVKMGFKLKIVCV